jgi:hypothetical protein
MRYLYKTRTMSEAVIRLQFFICMLIEKSLEAVSITVNTPVGCVLNDLDL